MNMEEDPSPLQQEVTELKEQLKQLKEERTLQNLFSRAPQLHNALILAARDGNFSLVTQLANWIYIRSQMEEKFGPAIVSEYAIYTQKLSNNLYHLVWSKENLEQKIQQYKENRPENTTTEKFKITERPSKRKTTTEQEEKPIRKYQLGTRQQSTRQQSTRQTSSRQSPKSGKKSDAESDQDF